MHGLLTGLQMYVANCVGTGFIVHCQDHPYPWDMNSQIDMQSVNSAGTALQDRQTSAHNSPSMRVQAESSSQLKALAIPKFPSSLVS